MVAASTGVNIINIVKAMGKKDAAHNDSSNEARSAASPETRLYPSVAAGVIVAAGLLLFGWTAHYRVHWTAPIVGSGLVGLGYFLVTLSARSYILETFGVWAVSAISIMLAVRNLVGSMMPLIGPGLFDSVGYGWGCSVLALLSVAVMPVSIVLIKYGKHLRTTSTLQVME